MELEDNIRRKTGKFTYTWKVNNTFLNISESKKKAPGKLGNILKYMKMKRQHTKFMECGENNVKREIYTYKYLH